MSKRQRSTKADKNEDRKRSEQRAHADESRSPLVEVLRDELDVSQEQAQKISTYLELRVDSVVRERFSGPLPPPHILAQYEEISPGLLDRIVAMAEGQARHRQQLEQKVVSDNNWLGKAGVVAGSLLGLAAMALVAFAIDREAPLEYVAGILAAIAALAGVYIYAKSRKTKEAEARAEKMQELFEATTSPQLDARRRRSLKPEAPKSPKSS